jgi:uncharacterized oligopeptide transporter (OPT) family protein
VSGRDQGAPAGGERELSARALVFGLVCGGLLAAANVYAGLMLGIVDDGAITVVLCSAAVMVPIGRVVGRPFSRLESNVAQAAGASAAGMGLAAGLIGPVPALALSGAPASPVWVALWGAALAIFGTLVAVPFRERFLVGKELPFPTGRATGELIVNLVAAPAGIGSAARVMLVAASAAALFCVGRDALHWLPAQIALPLAISGISAARLTVGLALSPLVAGVGLLVGLRVGLSALGGALLAWCAIAPGLVRHGLAQADYSSLVSWLLWPATALLVVSSLVSLALGGRGILRSWRGGAARTGDRGLRVAVIACAAVAIAVSWRAFGVHPVLAAAAVLLGAVFAVVGLHVTGETGQAPAGPLGGLTQIAVGAVAPGGVGAPLVSGGVVNGAVSHASTLMLSWKAGQVVGSSPRRLLAAQLSGVGLGVVCATVAYWLIDRAHGIGSETMPSPAVLSWKATAEAVQGGVATMPAGAPLAALVAAAVAALLAWAERRPRIGRFTPSAVALGIGFILPFGLAAVIAAAAVIGALLAARAPAWAAARTPALASGLLAGEGLTGVVIAALTVAGVL